MQELTTIWHIDLGRLTGNEGSQSYLIPPGVDLSGITGVTIWCDRFHVSFGAASLVAADGVGTGTSA